MLLTEEQRDALVEVLNIATARTGASLSALTGQRVILDVPRISLYKFEDLVDVLSEFIQGDIATIHQIFNGPVAGDAFLLLDYDAAQTLVNLFTDESPEGARMSESAREVLTEIGNILLNACLGVFGDLLKVRVSFAVPRLHMAELGGLLRSLMIEQSELQYGLVIHTNFRLRDNAVGGYLVLVLGVASLDQLIQAIDRLR